MSYLFKNISPVIIVIASWELGQLIAERAYLEYRKYQLQFENAEINSDAFYFEMNKGTVEMIPIYFENMVKDLSVYPLEWKPETEDSLLGLGSDQIIMDSKFFWVKEGYENNF